MEIRLRQQIERTFREVEATSALLLQLSEDLRKLQERVAQLEGARHGNRQRRTASSD
jgi:hypothetical protein